MPDKKWIQKATLNKGALHKDLGVPEDEVIGLSRIESEISKLKNKENLSDKEKKTLRRLYLAKTLIKARKESWSSERKLRLILELLKIDGTLGGRK